MKAREAAERRVEEWTYKRKKSIYDQGLREDANNRFIHVSFEFGIVIRKEAITTKDIGKEKIMEVFEDDKPLDESDVLLSFGPHFGTEAMEELGKRLSKLGLEYIDDFFYFHGDFPEWVKFSVDLK